MKSVAAVMALTLFSLAAPAQECANGRCYPTRRTSSPAIAAPKVEVEWHDGDPQTLWRFKVDGREIGTFDEADGYFSSKDGHHWKFTLKSGIGFVPVGQLPGVPDGGIDPARLCPDGKGGFSVNGVPVDRQSAFQSLLGSFGAMRDDSTHLRLSVIGSNGDRRKVTDDLKAIPALKDQLRDVLVSEFSPEAWAVKGLGFVQDGRPTIYIQAPGGRVLHRQDDYDGPEQLAGAIRKARDYDPKKDADLRKQQPEPTPTPAPWPVPNPTPTTPSFKVDALVIGGLIVAFFLFGRNRPV